jgi:hypothetical protein
MSTALSSRARPRLQAAAIASVGLVLGTFAVGALFGYDAPGLLREARHAIVGGPRWPEGDVFEVGETASLGCLSYTVNSVTWWSRPRSQFFRGESGDIRLLVVHMTVRSNDPRDARGFGGGVLYDDRGFGHSAVSWSVSTNNPEVPWETTPSPEKLDMVTRLPPLTSRSGLVLFEVPADREYRLPVHGGCGSNDLAQFMVHTPSDR